MRSIVLIANNLRSTQNVGSLLRTADGLGIKKVYLSGYTPYPLAQNDRRLPYLSKKIDKQITKVSLGSEKHVKWEHIEDINELINKLKKEGYSVFALEQTTRAIALQEFIPPEKFAIVVGREVEGLEAEVLDLCDKAVEIPMRGKKESFNVAQATAMALYHCVYYSK